jgi:hypothetical protein
MTVVSFVIGSGSVENSFENVISDSGIRLVISHFYTPSAFGGSQENAIEMLKKAISLNSTSDTAHI